jgi:hypothetical protein
MYTAAAMLLGGWAMLFWSRTLAIYAGAARMPRWVFPQDSPMWELP